MVMTLSRHLDADDHYSGLWYMYTDDLGATWKGPFEPPQLGAQSAGEGLHSSVHDVTPGCHQRTGKLLAIGGRTYYRMDGKHVSGDLRRGGTSYAVYDAREDRWSDWQALILPPAGQTPLFDNCRSACSQWVEKPDGTLLIPVYCQPEAGNPCWVVTVLHCRFDGVRLTYLRHGNFLAENTGRGLAEPSLAYCRGRYFLTIRHDERGYVAVSKDGLRFGPLRAWTNDDGSDLGSVNTQQHWLTYGDALYLTYTSQRAHNRHIARGRAPIYLAQVDPERLQVLRATEQVLIPERGLMLGNFGAAAVAAREAWVTDAEFLWYSHGFKPTAQGGDGSVWIARVNWPAGR